MNKFELLVNGTKEPNWDLEGGAPVPQALWDMAEAFVYRCSQELPFYKEPHVSPSGDGTVHLTWTNTLGGRFNLEIASNNWHIGYRYAKGAHYLSLWHAQPIAEQELKFFLYRRPTAFERVKAKVFRVHASLLSRLR